MNEKIVILARPHNMIVDIMKDFLIRNGFTPFPITNPDDLRKISNPANIKGAVISTAVTSVVKLSYIDSFTELRKQFPNIPVIFTTLVDTKNLSKFLFMALSRFLPDTKIIDISEKSLTEANLGTKNTFVILHKDEINLPDKSVFADNIIKSHFK